MITMLNSFKIDDPCICIIMVAFICELSQISGTCLGGRTTKDTLVGSGVLS